MPDTLAFPFLLAIALVVVGWFALGTHSNVRRGDVALKWLGQGLPLVGERTTMRWLGSSVVELKIAKAKGAYRSAETLVVFEPRDVVFLWALARLQGRRDLLIFRGQLTAAPSCEVEIFDPHGWTTSQKEQQVTQKKWTRADLPDAAALHAYYSGGQGAALVKPLLEMAQAGGKVVRISIHRDLPNVEVHWLLPDTTAGSAQSLFDGLQQIGQRVTRG